MAAMNLTFDEWLSMVMTQPESPERRQGVDYLTQAGYRDAIKLISENAVPWEGLEAMQKLFVDEHGHM